MPALRRSLSVLGLCFLTINTPVAAQAIGDLLPPAARQTEKRNFGNNEMEMRGYRGYDRGRAGAAFSPDGKLLAFSSQYTGSFVWDVATGKALGAFGNMDRAEGSTMAVSPDGKHLLLVSWGGYRGGEYSPVALWDLKKREKIRSVDEDVNDVAFTSAAFSPDGKTIALGGGLGRRNPNVAVHFWDVATGEELRKIDGLVNPDPNRRYSNVFHSIAYSPDGRNLALLTDGRVLLLEMATGKVRAQFTVPSHGDDRLMQQQQTLSVGALAFAPDGRTLAVGCIDGTVRRFELLTRRELPPLTGHASGVLALCYTSDGKTLQSFGQDQKFFAWPADVNRSWRRTAAPPTDKELEALWDVLRADDPLDVFGCIQILSSAPAQTVPFLQKRLTPVAAFDSARIDKLVADLQKGEYNDRRRAVAELRKIGPPALTTLRRAADGTGDDLTRRLVFEFEAQTPPRENIRAVRALEVLERIGTPEAGQLLDELAKGVADAPFTVQAKAAKERLTKAGVLVRGEMKAETLWEDLANDDSMRAFIAVQQIASRPALVKTFLRDRFAELAASEAFNDDPKRIAQLIADLDSEDFDTREKASKDLKNLGKLAEKPLRKALEAMPAAEVKRHLEEMLAAIGQHALAPDVLRVHRALEALEWIGTDDSREVVAMLVKDAHAQWLREAATAVMKRKVK